DHLFEIGGPRFQSCAALAQHRALVVVRVRYAFDRMIQRSLDDVFRHVQVKEASRNRPPYVVGSEWLYSHPFQSARGVTQCAGKPVFSEYPFAATVDPAPTATAGEHVGATVAATFLQDRHYLVH